MAIGLAAQAAFGPILKPLGDRAGARAIVRGETHVLQDTAYLLRKMEPTPSVTTVHSAERLFAATPHVRC